MPVVSQMISVLSQCRWLGARAQGRSENQAIGRAPPGNHRQRRHRHDGEQLFAGHPPEPFSTASFSLPGETRATDRHNKAIASRLSRNFRV